MVLNSWEKRVSQVYSLCNTKGRLFVNLFIAHLCKSIFSTFAEEVATLEEETVEETPETPDVETTATVSDETKAAPEFVVVVEDVKVKEGKPAKFVAKATGEPVPKITWYHDNEPITEGDIYKIRYSHKSNIIDTKYI